MVKDGKTTQASEDAKPYIERYKKKVEKLGGYVLDERVNGVLAVARAIGDRHIVGDIEGQCCVSPSPKITCYSLKDFENGFLVLACDGLYDVSSSNEAGLYVQLMANRKITAGKMAHQLVYSALSNESKDNVSVMVVGL